MALTVGEINVRLGLDITQLDKKFAEAKKNSLELAKELGESFKNAKVTFDLSGVKELQTELKEVHKLIKSLDLKNVAKQVATIKNYKQPKASTKTTTKLEPVVPKIDTDKALKEAAAKLKTAKLPAPKVDKIKVEGLDDIKSKVSGVGSGFGGVTAALGSFNVALSAVGAIGSAAFDLIASGVRVATQAFKDAAKSAMEFQANMSEVAALGQIDQASQEFSALSQFVLKLGADSKFTAAEVASGASVMAAAGYEVGQIFQGLPGIVALASVENMSFADATSIATSAIAGFQLAASDIGMVADVLAQTSADANVSVANLGGSFKYLAPVASQLKLEFTDVSAALGVLSNYGIKSTMAGRNLASGLMSLAGPSEKAAALMQELGIQVNDAQGNFKSLPDIIDTLSGAFEGMSDAQKVAALTTLMGKDNVKSWLPLIQEGSGAIREFSANLQNSAGAAQEMANVKMDNLSGDIEKLSGAWDAFTTSGFERITPIFRAVVQGITQAVETLGPIILSVMDQIGASMQPVIAQVLPNLKQAWATLAPAIQSVLPVLGQVAGYFGALAGQALVWGSQIVAQIAKGMAAAIQQVVAVLQQLGAIIRYWLQPNSPPKIVPELDQYGTDAAQVYLDGFLEADTGVLQGLGSGITTEIQNLEGLISGNAQRAGTVLASGIVAGFSNADFSIFDNLSNKIESVIRSFGESGAIPKEGIVPQILGSREALAEAIRSMDEFGTVSSTAMSNLMSALGPVAPEVQNVVQAYFDLETASRNTARAQSELKAAQEELNRVTEEYNAILEPLNDQMDAIQKEKQRIRDMERVEELQKTIADSSSTANEKRLAELELEEIALRQQISAVEDQKDIALEAAEANVEGAEANVKAAQEAENVAKAHYDAQSSSLEIISETNSLLGEQAKILQEIADAAKNAAGAGGGIGGGGAGLGGLGGLGAVELPDLSEIEPVPPEVTASIQDIASALGSVSQVGEDVKSFLSGFSSSFSSAFSAFGNLKSIIQSDGIGSLNSFFGSVERVYNGLKTIFDPLMGIYQSIFGVISGLVTQYGGTILTNVQSTFNSLISIIGSVFSIVGKILGPIFNFISGTIQQHSESIVKIIGGTWTIVTTIISQSLGLIATTLEAGLAVLDGDFSKAKGLALQASKDVKQGFQDIIGGVVDVASGSGKLILDEFFDNDFNGAGGYVAKEFSSGFGTTISGLPTLAGQAGQDTLGSFSKATEGATEVGAKASRDIVSGFAGNKGSLDSAVNDAKNAVNGITFNDLTGVGSTAGSQLTAGWTSGTSTLGAVGTLAASLLTGGVTGGLAVLPSVLSQAGIDAGNAFDSATANYTELGSKAAQRAVQGLGGDKTYAEEAGREIAEAAGKGFEEGTSYFPEMSVKAGQSLTGGFGSATSNANQLGATAGTNLNTGLQSTQATIGSTASALGAKVLEMFKGGTSSASTEGTNVGNKLKTGLSGTQTDVGSAGNQLGQAAITGFKEGSKEAEAVGKNISEGIARGITSGTPAIKSAARKAANEALKAAKAELGIHSPSKVFEDEVGLQSDKGLAKGLIKGIPEVKKAATDLASKLKEKVKGETKDSADIGVGVVARIADGISQSEQVATKAVKKIVDKVVKGIKEDPEPVGAGTSLGENIATGLLKSLPTISNVLSLISSKVIDGVLTLRDGVVGAMGDLGEIISNQMKILETSQDALGDIAGFLPDFEPYREAQESYQEAVDALNEFGSAKQQILKIEQEYAAEVGAIQDELKKAQEKFNADFLKNEEDYREKVAKANKDYTKKQENYSKKLQDVNKKIADLEKEPYSKSDREKLNQFEQTRSAIDQEIANLGVISPDDVLNQERLAALQKDAARLKEEHEEFLAELNLERDEKLNDLLEDRKEIEESIIEMKQDHEEKLRDYQESYLEKRSSLEESIAEKRISTEEKLMELQTEFEKNKLDLLEKEKKLQQDYFDAMQKLRIEQYKYQEQQRIADKYSQDVANARLETAALERIDPELASKFYSERIKQINAIASLEHKLAGTLDAHQQDILRRQIEQQKLLANMSEAALKASSIQSIQNMIQQAPEELNKKLKELQEKEIEASKRASGQAGRSVVAQEYKQLKEQAQRESQVRLQLLQESLALISKIDYSDMLVSSAIPNINPSIAPATNTISNTYTVNAQYPMQSALSVVDEMRMLMMLNN